MEQKQKQKKTRCPPPPPHPGKNYFKILPPLTDQCKNRKTGKRKRKFGLLHENRELYLLIHHNFLTCPQKNSFSQRRCSRSPTETIIGAISDVSDRCFCSHIHIYIYYACTVQTKNYLFLFLPGMAYHRSRLVSRVTQDQKKKNIFRILRGMNLPPSPPRPNKKTASLQP